MARVIYREENGRQIPVWVADTEEERSSFSGFSLQESAQMASRAQQYSQSILDRLNSDGWADRASRLQLQRDIYDYSGLLNLLKAGGHYDVTEAVNGLGNIQTVADDRSKFFEQFGNEEEYGAWKTGNDLWRSRQSEGITGKQWYQNASAAYSEAEETLGALEQRHSELTGILSRSAPQYYGRGVFAAGRSEEELAPYRQELERIEAQIAQAQQALRAAKNELDYASAYRFADYEDRVDFEGISQGGLQRFAVDKLAYDQQTAQAQRFDIWAQIGADAPAIAIQNASRTAERDLSFMQPTESWTEEQRRLYGYLYATDRQEADAYAMGLNEYYNALARGEQEQAVAKWATRNGWNKALATAASILAVPAHGAEFAMDAMQYAHHGLVADTANMGFADFSNVVQEAVAASLNEKGGTLREDLPVIGGKGWGDLYQMGVSVIQSMAAAYTGGTAMFFGTAAKNGLDNALERGATPEQALVIGLAAGTAEVLFEKFSIDALIKTGASRNFGQFVLNSLKQGGIEASEETATSIANLITDAIVMGQNSEFRQTVNSYMTENGMSYSEAQRRAMLDQVESVAYDAVAGFVSGAIGAGVKGGAVTAIENRQLRKEFGGQVADLVEETLEFDPNDELALKIQLRLDGKKTVTGGQVRQLLERNLELRTGQLRQQLDQSKTEEEEVFADETVTLQDAPTPEPLAELEAAETDRVAAEQIPAQTKGTPASAVGSLEQELMGRLDVEGLDEANAVLLFNEESRRMKLEMQEAYAVGDDARGDTYSRVLDLMNEAVRTARGDMQAVTAFMKGALSHGGSVLHDGTGRRDAGEGTGVEAGRVRPEQNGDDARREAVRKGNGPAAFEAPWTSAEELGIPKGAAERINRVVPETAYNAGMKNAAEEAAALGCRIRFVSGAIRIWNEIKRIFQDVSGVAYGTEIVVQSDHRLYTAEQLAEHELMHVRMAQDPGLRQEAVEAMRKKATARELQELAAKYANGYGFIYGTYSEEMTADELAELDMKYLEEAICDATAGINRSFGGRAALRFGEVVSEVVRSRIGMGNGSGGMPGSRYMINEDFYDELARWYRGIPAHQRYTTYRSFNLGRTSAALRSIGVADGPVRMRGHKIQEILDKHSEMTLEDIMAIPEILEDPVLVMKSATVNDSIVVVNERTVKDGRREFVALSLRPGKIAADAEDFTQVTSAYGRTDGNIKNLITGGAGGSGSEMLYLTEDVNRAEAFLRLLGVQFPSSQKALGPIGTITYADGGVNIQGKTYKEWMMAEVRGQMQTAQHKIKSPAQPVAPPENGYYNSTAVSDSDDSISDGTEKSNSDFHLSAGEKSPEEMTVSELRKAVREDQSLVEAYRQIREEGGLTPAAQSQMQAVQQRLEAEREALQKKNEAYAAQKQDARERARKRATPVRAKRDFRKEMLDIFSTQSGMREELGRMVDRFAEETLSRGAVSYRDMKQLFDRLYESGMMSAEADPLYQDIRSGLAGTRIYVDENTRHEFGDSESYNRFRREAFANGVILTSDESDNHLDTLYMELADRHPGEFRSESGDMKAMLEEIVHLAREGKAENVSLAEMMRRVENETGWSFDDQMDSLERKVEHAIDKFIEKADLERDLKARSAVQMAQERQERRQAMERQSKARNMREMQQKTMKALQWLKKNELKLPEQIKSQAQELLDGLDLYAVSLADEMRWSDKHQATWRDLADMYQNAMETDPNFLPSEELKKIWSRVNLKKVGELDLDALETMYRAASALRQEYYDRNNVLDSEEHLLFSEAYEDSVKEIKSSGGRGKLGKWFNAEQLTPVNVLEMMGGWRRNGTFFSFGRMLESGERDYKSYVVEAKAQLQEFIEEHKDWIARADGQGKDAVWYKVEVPELLELRMGDKPIFGETKTVWMTPAQKVHLYLESKNYQNLRHMAGGRTFVNRALYEQGKRTEALSQGTTIRLAPESVKRLVSDLTEEEMALAEALQKYYDVFASGKINRVSNILYGFDKAVTKNYAPIFSDRNYTKSEPGIFDVTAEGVGHMKGREERSKKPSWNISAFDAWERHIEQTGRFVGYSIPVRNMNRLMNWQANGESMRKEITRVWGEEGAQYVENYIKTLQSPVFQDRSTLQEAADKLLSNYISGVFGANPSVVLKQLLSFQMAGSVLDFKNLPTPAQLARTDAGLIAKYTPELEYRRMGYATPEVAQLKDNPNWTQKNKAIRFIFGGGAITWTDAGTATALWPWAENYVRRNFPELETGSREQIEAGQSPFYRKVAEVYNDAVVNTQSMSDISHRPEIMRKKDLARAFTMFKSDSAQAYNTVRRLSGELSRAAKDGDAGKARDARTKLAAGVTGIILSQLGGGAINFLMALWKNKAKWYRDDEDELTAQSVAKEYTTEVLEGLAGMVLGGEELMRLILGMINGESWYGQNSVEEPGAEQLNDFLDAIREAAGSISEIINGSFVVLKNGGDVSQYLRRNAGTLRGTVKDVALNMSQSLAGASFVNLEKYLLGAVSWIWPEGAVSYENWFETADKGSLSGLEGEALAATVGDVLYLRGIEAEDATEAELARLYEAGETSAVPSNVSKSFSENGVAFEMNAAHVQIYERTYAEAIGGYLNELVESAAYIEADDETRAKMLARLYDYAADEAKRAVNPDFEGDTWTRKAGEAAEEGLSVCAYAALQSQGLSRNAEKMDYIDGMELSEDQKGLLWYYAVASDSRMEDADAMREAGMSWGDVFETVGEYMEIDEMTGTTASMKAATFKTWALENLSAPEAASAIENLTYSSGMQASTETYDKLLEYGLGSSSALALNTAWSDLEPEEGAGAVSDLQRMNAILETIDDREEQMEALNSMLGEVDRWKLERVTRYDVTAEIYIEFRNTLQDYYAYDPEGSENSLNQKEITAALRSMNWLTIPQKAALWQIQAMDKNGADNPFSTGIGLEVYLDYEDWKDSREE